MSLETPEPSASGIRWKAGVPRAIAADDDPQMLRLLLNVLRTEGYDVTEAHNGRELVECVEECLRETGRPPDMIVSDVQMPLLSGPDALAMVRKDLGETILVLVTANFDAAVLVRAEELGVHSVLAKPFLLDDLRAVVSLRRKAV